MFDEMINSATLLMLASLGTCLKLLDVRVPGVVDVRDEAVLTCNFDLEDDGLFSLKWYKEELEFFRYMPGSAPPIQTFPVDGIHLAKERSNMSTVTLSPLEYSTSGIYRCELSTEAPHFKIKQTTANMSVLGLPSDDPSIDGVQSSYAVGSYVIANCTSSPSHPPARMEWYINGAKAQHWFLDYYYSDKPSNELDMESRTIGLKFQTESSHFNTKDGTLSLNCSATVEGRMRSSVTKAHLSNLLNQKFAQEKFTNGSCPTRSPFFATLFIFLVLRIAFMTWRNRQA